MKALQLVDEPQDKIAIKEVEIPELGPYDVLVKIKAAALNHRDQWCREGKYPNMKYNVTLGSDGAGVVEAGGDKVDSSWLHQEVIINPNINWGLQLEAQNPDYHILGMPSDGTLAEYVVVHQDRLLHKPFHLTFEQAAALPLAGLTAYRAAFFKGQVTDIETVLVTGIGGGVSQMAFLFATAVGAKVYVTSGSEEKLQRAKEMGATDGFNYREEGWQKKAIEGSDGGFNVIIDSAGGDQLNNYIKILKPGGRIVCYGSTAGTPQNFEIFRLFWNQASILGSTMGSDKEFGEMVQFINKHKLVPIVDSTRPFDQIVSAFDDMRDAKQFGKLVVTF